MDLTDVITGLAAIHERFAALEEAVQAVTALGREGFDGGGAPVERFKDERQAVKREMIGIGAADFAGAIVQIEKTPAAQLAVKDIGFRRECAENAFE